MSIALSGTERARLVKVLGLMSSDHDGERAAAAWQATRLVKSRGLSWDDLISDGLSLHRVPPKERMASAAQWMEQVRFILSHERLLSQWEKAFAISLYGRARITPKQADVLIGVVDRLTAQGAK